MRNNPQKSMKWFTSPAIHVDVHENVLDTTETVKKKRKIEVEEEGEKERAKEMLANIKKVQKGWAKQQQQ